jgi:hypothetical protein
MEITKGKWEVSKGLFAGYRITVDEVYVVELWKKDDAILVSDAGNTYQATNKLPSELAEANKELLEALKIAKLCSNHEDAKEAYGHINTHWTNVIDNTIKKHSHA